MKQYKFRAMITLDPVARDGAAPDYPSGTHVLTVPLRRHAGPGDRRCLPAVISGDVKPPLPHAVHAVITVALADGEAEKFFAPGRPFTVWADSLVGDAIRPGGLVGHGVISGRVYRQLARAAGTGDRRRTTAAVWRQCLAAVPGRAAADHGQRMAV